MRKRKKILFITAWYPSAEWPVSGIFVKEHAKSVALFNDVAVIHGMRTPHLAGKNKTNHWMDHGIRLIQFRYYLPYMPGRNNISPNYFMGVLSSFIRLLREGFSPDIIHAHVFTAALPAVIIGRLTSRPVVVTEHWSIFARHRLRPIDHIQARLALNKADIVLTVSKDLADALRSYGISTDIEIVPNTFDTSIFYPPRELVTHKKKRILLVALLTPIKGIDYLFKALVRLKQERDDFILDIVGDGPSSSEYKSLSEKLGLTKMITFHGLKTKKEIASFMRNASFFVLPSLWENMPCVLVEAMACGLPLVTTRVGGIPEIVDEKMGILVTPGDTDELYKALRYMLDNYNRYPRSEIAKYAHKNFSLQSVGSKLDSIYSKVINGRT
ncbi:MAG: hypothetical protein DRG37_01910 [Deltaproteobacteria bacterium]|nr:MAG: hypothetical protein DRG37_01910 [Deltaproteobacteria bacterium]